MQRQKEVRPAPSRHKGVEAYLDYWLHEVARTRVRQVTFESYRRVTALHLIPGLAGVRLGGLRPGDVQRLVGERLAAGYSPSFVRQMIRILRIALEHAWRWGLVERNVAKAVAPPRVPRRQQAHLDGAGARRLLGVLRRMPHEAEIVLALGLGLRMSEVLGLQWQDIDLRGGKVAVRRTVHRTIGAVQVNEPKTPRGTRTLVLPGFVAQALRRHRTKLVRKGILIVPGGYLFAGKLADRPYHPTTLMHALHRALDAAELPRMRFHDLRHTTATLLLLQRVHPRVVMEIMGHSQIRVTMETYSHVLPALHTQAAAEMDKVMRTKGRMKKRRKS